jgi:DNA-binding LacI/PurR family transcriptional regulator
MYPEGGEFCLLLAANGESALGDPFTMRVTQGVMEGVSDPSRPLTLAYYEPEKDYTAHPEALPHPVRSGVASKFLFFGPGNATLVQHIVRRGLPVVSLGTEVTFPGVISLVPDFPAASQMAFEHLHQLGHLRIGIVSGPFGATETQIIELHRGIRQACAALGLAIEAQNIIYGDLSYRAGMKAMEEFQTRAQKPTAIFCLSDSAAAGVIGQCHRMGLRVPEDVSVIGCADDFCSHIIVPPLTTIHLPAEEMGARGVKEIDRLVRESQPIEPRRHVVPVHLIQRGSTGPLQPTAAS